MRKEGRSQWRRTESACYWIKTNAAGIIHSFFFLSLLVRGKRWPHSHRSWVLLNDGPLEGSPVLHVNDFIRLFSFIIITRPIVVPLLRTRYYGKRKVYARRLTTLLNQSDGVDSIRARPDCLLHFLYLHILNFPLLPWWDFSLRNFFSQEFHQNTKDVYICSYWCPWVNQRPIV